MDDKRPKRSVVFKNNKQSKKPAKPALKSEPSFSFCQVKEECQACPFVNEDYKQTSQSKYQLQLKQIKSSPAFSKTRTIPLTNAPKSLAYKTSTKVYVVKTQNRDNQNEYSFQLYGNKARKRYDIDFCPVHTKTIGQFVRKLKRIFETTNLTPYNKSSKEGNFKFVEIRSSHLTNEIMIKFHVTEDLKNDLKRVTTQLRHMEVRIISAHMVIETETETEDNITTRIAGVDKLRESYCDLNFEISPDANFNSNPWQNINVLRRVEQIADVPPRSSYAWDIYSKNAQFSMLLARAGYETYSMESNETEYNDGINNIQKNELSDKIHSLKDSISNFAIEIPESAQKPLLILANTHEKGMDLLTKDRLVEVLKDSKKTKVLYLNMSTDKFIEDIEYLEKSGRQARQIEAFDVDPLGKKLLWLAVIV